MIKKAVVTSSMIFLFSGCAIFQPDFGVPKKEPIVSKMAPLQPQPSQPQRVVTAPQLREEVSLPVQTVPYIKTPPPQRHIMVPEPSKRRTIKDVFTEETPERLGSQQLINYLDAFSWEKKALSKAYSRERKLWTKREIQSFLAIVNEDKYLSLCGDKRYMDNLIFTSNPAKQDLLYSILLLRYLNNLSNGCREWVSSDGELLNENSKEYIESNYLLSMLSKDILIERLFTRYIPKNKDFFPALKRYKLLTKYLEKSDEIKNERLQIEAYKSVENHPDYE